MHVKLIMYKKFILQYKKFIPNRGKSCSSLTSQINPLMLISEQKPF